MPKIIRDLDDKIIASCKNLFFIHSYDSVEMKMIAKDCGIAVGTLYNYYDSKWDVFSKVLSLFWDNILRELDELYNRDNDDSQRFYNAVGLLGKELENKTSLSTVFYDSRGLTESDKLKVKEIYDEVISSISRFLRPLSSKSEISNKEQVEKRFAEHILLTLTYMDYKLDETDLLAKGIVVAMEQVLKVSKVEFNQ